MPDLAIADIRVDGTDASGLKILAVYSRRPPLYAVYRTKDRVVIQFADNSIEQDKQRAALATLNPLRGQINGLINGWRSSKKQRLAVKATRYDAQVADALVVGLEKDIEGARSILELIKADIIAKRTSWARLLYLLVSTGAVICFVLFFVLLDWLFRAHMPDAARNLWLGAGAGSVGALFSIAIGMSDRTVMTDLHKTDNAVDAILRVGIGLIGGGVLVALLASKLVVLSVDGARPEDGVVPWLFVMLAGFIAGFSERLVPDLLAKATVQGNVPPPSTKVPIQAAGGAGAPGNASTPPPAEQEDSEQTDSESDTDHCLCDNHVHANEITPDTELPPASGGVAHR